MARKPTTSIPLVGIIMGSDSDWPVMEAAATALAEFGVAYEADVVSAHLRALEVRLIFRPDEGRIADDVAALCGRDQGCPV